VKEENEIASWVIIFAVAKCVVVDSETVSFFFLFKTLLLDRSIEDKLLLVSILNTD
jgi:hypothetical protein